MITWFIILVVIYLIVFDLSLKMKKKKTTKVFIEEMQNLKERFELKQKKKLKN